MKRLGILIWSLIGSCSPGSQSSNPLTGKDIYRQNCILCHGIKGDLETNGAKNLTRSVISLEERILVITEGRNVMTGFKEKLTPDEIQKVAEFTLQLKAPNE